MEQDQCYGAADLEDELVPVIDQPVEPQLAFDAEAGLLGLDVTEDAEVKSDRRVREVTRYLKLDVIAVRHHDAEALVDTRACGPFAAVVARVIAADAEERAARGVFVVGIRIAVEHDHAADQVAAAQARVAQRRAD